MRLQRWALRSLALLLAGWLATAVAVAGALPAGELEQRCWQQFTRERTRVDLREPTEVAFSNLRDGYSVASPFLVEFAVRGMGVAPAGVKLERTGHHHILIDHPLPSSVTAQIPFDNTHRHFGKGQTSTLLDLPAGRHTLRLLFADFEHRPYFVYSREIEVTVRGARSSVPQPRIEAARFEQTCPAWYQDEVSRPRPPDEPLYFANVRNDEALVSPFNLRLGVDGFGVCAKGGQVAKTGHFVVEQLDPASRAVEHTWDLVNGATQLNLVLAVGSQRLRLRFVDDRGADLLPPNELPLRVVAQERL